MLREEPAKNASDEDIKDYNLKRRQYLQILDWIMIRELRSHYGTAKGVTPSEIEIAIGELMVTKGKGSDYAEVLKSLEWVGRVVEDGYCPTCNRNFGSTLTTNSEGLAKHLCRHHGAECAGHSNAATEGFQRAKEYFDKENKDEYAAVLEAYKEDFVKTSEADISGRGRGVEQGNPHFQCRHCEREFVTTLPAMVKHVEAHKKDDFIAEVSL